MDYAALAKQAGGKVDYSALAKQAGGVPTSKNGMPTSEPTSVKTSFLQKLSNFGKGASDFNIGMAKGAASTVKGISDLGNKALGGISDVLGIHNNNPNVPTTPTDIIPQSVYTPQNTNEKAGFGVEQTAELLAPVGISEKGLTTTAKIAKSALEFGGKTAAQTGGDAKKTAVAALSGGLLEGASIGIGKLLEKIPENAWSTILKRTSTQVAKNPNLPAKAAETGMTGTRNSIISQSQNNIQKIELALDDLLKSSNEKIGTLKIAPYLDELRNSYKNIPGEQGSVDIINNVMTDLLKQKSVTPLEANQVKRNIYDLISKSYGKGALEVSAKTEAQKQIARGLKSEIEKIIPEAKTLNEQQAVYIQIKKALDRLSNASEGKGIAGTGLGLYDLMTGGLTEIAGLATGHPLLGVGAIAAKKTAESTPVLSSAAKLAKYFDNLSPTKKVLFKKAIEVLGVKGTTSSGN